MKFNYFKGFVISVLALGAGSLYAQTYFQTNGSSMSAYRDTSNMWIDFGSNWNIEMQRTAADPDHYINQFSMTTAPGYDPLLDVTVPTTSFNYNGGSGTYTLGTAISGDQNWNFAAASRASGAINAAVADGTYGFNVKILGGTSSVSTDVLADYDFNLTVLQKLDLAIDLFASPSTIGQGAATEISMTVKNNMSGNSFLSTSWWWSNFDDGAGNFLTPNSFDGDWFSKTIASGDSRTDLHSNWSAAPDQALGLYNGNLGVVGGLYAGDFYFIGGTPSYEQAHVMVVVPEPASFAVLGLGALALLRRRRKSK